MGRHNKYIKWWFWSGAALVFIMLLVGGITRLTGSGLSITEWNLIMGAKPPINQTEWMAAFSQYKQFPQYQQLNASMTLTQFKYIFFWEYLHRLLGRIIGIIFIIPFLFFWFRGYFNRKTWRQALFLLFLGMLQGAMGWFMVKSGLVGVPYVSHYRLALHLLLAFLITGCCIWFALGLKQDEIVKKQTKPFGLKKWAIGIGFLLIIQITWGAFTAGLNAGYIYNTFPLMAGGFVPPNAWAMQPLILNFFENAATVQWFHRINGTVLGLLIIVLWVKSLNKNIGPILKRKTHLLLGLVLTQYLLGILTLLFHVPVFVAVAHQAVAMLLWFAWLAYYHHLKKYRLYHQINYTQHSIFKKY
ncbi:MAG TPA: COX15/CtaA family protein [Balneolaceae bacterium]|nr:COX15/CtaA family protein [Balneolaceae bacterium]